MSISAQNEGLRGVMTPATVGVMTPDKVSSMTGKGTPRRTIRIDDELWNMVTEYATSVGETASSVIRSALYEYTLTFPMSEAAIKVRWPNGMPADLDTDQTPA